MLDVINQQGAQVQALKATVKEQQIVISLLLNQIGLDRLVFGLDDLKDAKHLEGASWSFEDNKLTIEVDYDNVG